MLRNGKNKIPNSNTWEQEESKMKLDRESNLWDLKLKNSEQLGIQLKNINNCHIHTKQATINKGGNKMKILQEREKYCELTKGRKNDSERIEGGEIVRVRNRNKHRGK